MKSQYDEKINEVLTLYHEGKSLREMSEVVGVAEQVVRNWLRKNDIVINTRRKMYDEYIRKITELYDEGKTIREIAEIVGKHEAQVGQWLKQSGTTTDRGRGRRKYKTPYVTKQCEICGNDYQVESWRQDQSRFCGHRCFGVHHSGNLKGVSRTTYTQPKKSETRSETLKNSWTSERKKVASDRFKALWADPNSNIHNRITGNRKESVTERLLGEPLEKQGYEHNRSLWIQGLDPQGKTQKRLPDFIDYSNKKVLEYFGTYWHRNDNEQEIIAWYRHLGWECRIVWEKDLSDFLDELGI